MLTKIKFKSFTAFEKLEIDCSSGLNVFIGTNGTGKTHILKTLYAACDITMSKKGFAEKINKVFLPSKEQIGHLVKRSSVSTSGYTEITRKLPSSRESIKIRLSMSNHTKTPDKASVSGFPKRWLENKIESVYIPVKEMLSNAPGFRSLYSSRHLAFEEIYADILDRALLPLLRGPADKDRFRILKILQDAMDGKVTIDNEEFFLRNKQGKLEFTLLAEGIRKLGLLWVLIQNGTLLHGSVLCWDEPEANLNPKLMKTIIKILLDLHRMGVQIFLATHDYVLLKEIDLQMERSDDVKFHALYRVKDTNNIAIRSTSNYLEIEPNAIDEAYADLIDKEIDRSMGGLGK